MATKINKPGGTFDEVLLSKKSRDSLFMWSVEITWEIKNIISTFSRYLATSHTV